MFTKENLGQWLKAAGVRAIKTVAETAVATIGTSAILSQVDWRLVISASILSGILSLLISVKGLPEVKYVAKSDNLYISDKDGYKDEVE